MNAFYQKPLGLLRKGISLFYFIPVILLFAIAVYFISRKKEIPVPETSHANQTPIPAEKNAFMFRMNGFDLTKPLLFSSPANESENLKSVKNELSAYFKEQKAAGIISNASVHIKELMDGSWTTVDSDEAYIAGSIMKISTLIAILKDAESRPGLLEKKIIYDQNSGEITNQTFNSGSIEKGKSYTVAELLEYMIIKNDNRAKMLLDRNVSHDKVNHLFSDLGLPDVETPSKNYPLTSIQCSRLLEILFDATYLTSEHASFAMKLLTQSNFEKGIVSGVPDNSTVAHAFGEAKSDTKGESQLHETGIVFLEGNPYLITVMTKGSDIQKLPAVLSEVSKRVYKFMLTNKPS